MMENIREKQKAEGRKRLEMLRIMDEVLEGYDAGKIFYSERMSKFMDGILFFCDNRPDLIHKINEIEQEYGLLIYHAHLTHTIDGEMWTFLYVSKYEDEWESDREDLEDGCPVAYVDWTDQEFGRVGIVPKNGGVSRTF